MYNKYIISDPSITIQENEKIDNLEKKLREKVYTSSIEDSGRYNFFLMVKKVKGNIEYTFENLINLVIKDINSKLCDIKIKEKELLISSNKYNNIIFRIEKFESSKIFKVVWVYQNQFFSREIRFKKNRSNTKTKIYYKNLVIGSDINDNVVNTMVVSNYHREQAQMFKNMINKLIILNNVEKEKLIKKLRQKYIV